MQKWDIEYKGKKITLINKGLKGEELYIDGELKDKTRTIFGDTRLIAKIDDENIRANIIQKIDGYQVEMKADEKDIFTYKMNYGIKEIGIYVIIFFTILGMTYCF